MSAELSQTIKNGGIAVIATDTLYGVVASAHNKDAVERIYTLKGRDENKPFIILVADIEALNDFGIELTQEIKEKLSALWPNALTVILPVKESEQDRLHYLHRGTNALAFRMPAKEELRQLLAEVGPIVAPSANPQGVEPAKTIGEAKIYFGDNVDHYQDGGAVEGLPSTIISITDGAITIIRQGSVTVV